MIGDRMAGVLDEAEREAGVIGHGGTLAYRSHNFGHPRGSKQATSPKKSESGLYYIECRDCRRSIIEGGLGSAKLGNCTGGGR